MTPRQVLLVQRSFFQLARDLDGMAASFFQNLDRLNPKLRRHFGADLEAQGARLTRALARLVKSLGRLDELEDEMRMLGRHGRLGPSRDGIVMVGCALLETVRQRLKPAHEVEAAWAEAYAVLSRALQEGREQPSKLAA